jgi:Flp pilus assembly protein TadG
MTTIRFSGGPPVRRTRRSARGSAAVEFALLVPLLFLILFGIIDYGLWFNDSLSVRQGVREAARQGIVQNYNDPACTESAALDRLSCQTKISIGAVTGPMYVRVIAPNGWTRGKPLVVCGMVEASAVTGLVPLPSDGLVKSKTRMSIETMQTPVPAGAPPASTVDASAPGGWSWCS